MIRLSAQELEQITAILRAQVPEYAVWSFGSRVHGRNLKPHSDLDLAILTDQPLSATRLLDLQQAFADSDLPFRVDIIDWAAISAEFRELIHSAYIELQPDTNSARTALQ
jgi:predicted nucleotidyltransferase